jgi:hypothetical protein
MTPVNEQQQLTTGIPWLDSVLKWASLTGVSTVILFIMLPRHLDLMESVKSSIEAHTVAAAAQTEVLRGIASDQRGITDALSEIDRRLEEQGARIERLGTKGI